MQPHPTKRENKMNTLTKLNNQVIAEDAAWAVADANARSTRYARIAAFNASNAVYIAERVAHVCSCNAAVAAYVAANADKGK